MLLLLACAGSTDPGVTPGMSGVDPCATLDWYTTGAPFVLTWCTSCHSPGLADAARHGAPTGFDLGDLESVRTHADASRRRIEAGTMPPTGGPSEAEITRFVAWLECDAEAEEPEADNVAFPAATPSDRTIRGAWEVSHDVTLEADFPEGLTVTATQLGQGSTTGLAVLAVERYTLTDTEAWLVERARYAEDGTVVFVDTWEPPLQVVADRDSWVAVSTRTHRTPEAELDHDESWRFTLGNDPAADPRLGDPNERYVSGIEDETGAEIAYYLSSNRGLDGRHFADVGDFADPAGAVFDVRLLGALPMPGTLPAFPIVDGQHWNAVVLLWDPS